MVEDVRALIEELRRYKDADFEMRQSPGDGMRTFSIRLVGQLRSDVFEAANVIEALQAKRDALRAQSDARNLVAVSVTRQRDRAEADLATLRAAAEEYYGILAAIRYAVFVAHPEFDAAGARDAVRRLLSSVPAGDTESQYDKAMRERAGWDEWTEEDR